MPSPFDAATRALQVLAEQQDRERARQDRKKEQQQLSLLDQLRAMRIQAELQPWAPEQLDVVGEQIYQEPEPLPAGATPEQKAQYKRDLEEVKKQRAAFVSNGRFVPGFVQSQRVNQMLGGERMEIGRRNVAVREVSEPQRIRIAWANAQTAQFRASMQQAEAERQNIDSQRKFIDDRVSALKKVRDEAQAYLNGEGPIDGLIRSWQSVQRFFTDKPPLNPTDPEAILNTIMPMIVDLQEQQLDVHKKLLENEKRFRGKKSKRDDSGPAPVRTKKTKEQEEADAAMKAVEERLKKLGQ